MRIQLLLAMRLKVPFKNSCFVLNVRKVICKLGFVKICKFTFLGYSITFSMFCLFSQHLNGFLHFILSQCVSGRLVAFQPMSKFELTKCKPMKRLQQWCTPLLSCLNVTAWSQCACYNVAHMCSVQACLTSTCSTTDTCVWQRWSESHCYSMSHLQRKSPSNNYCHRERAHHVCVQTFC